MRSVRMSNGFKIDVIVWKFRGVIEAYLRVNGFKIDVIVWKWSSEFYNISLALSFKIDVIVWKSMEKDAVKKGDVD